MAKNSYLDKIVRDKLGDYEVAYNAQDWTLLNAMINEGVVPTEEVMDQAAKDALDTFEVAYEPTDWALMNEVLDVDMPEIVDETAKSQLDSFETPYNTNDWAIMNALLDADMPNVIDSTAKSQLDNFEIPYDSSNWAIMSALLDNDVTFDIDKLAKDNLDDFEVPYDAKDWAVMEEELDKVVSPNLDDIARQELAHYEPTNIKPEWGVMATLLASLEGDVIDNVAKDALQDQTVEFNPTDWHLMSDKLDDLGFTDEVDTLAQQALQHNEVTYQPKDWAMMEEQLNIDNRNRNRLLMAKGVELFLMVFAIWTIFLFVPYGDNEVDINSDTQNLKQSPNIEQHQPLNTPESEEDNWDNSDQPIAQNDIQTNIDNTTTNDNIIEETTTARVSNHVVTPPIQNESILNQKRVVQNTSPKYKTTKVDNFNYVDGSRNPYRFPFKKGQLEKNQPLPNATFDKSKLPFTEKELLEAIQLVQANKNAKNPDFLDGKFAYLPEERHLDMPSDHHPKFKLPINRIALLAGGDYHQINSPVDAPLKESQRGYSFGIRVDFEINEKWEFATGIMMAEYFYAHRTLEPLSQAANTFTLVGTNSGKVTNLQIPIHVQYNVYDNYPWRAYAIGGVTSHFVVDIHQSTGEMTLVNVANISTNNGQIDPRKQNVEELGIFEGGNMDKNFFTTLDAGVGIERRIDENWGVFVQPTYRVGLNPTGNDQDRINTLSFLVGTRLSL